VTKKTRIRILVPAAVVVLFLFGGWTLRNKLAADRQGDWVRATRGDLITGFEVTGTLSSVRSDSLGPPPLPDVWNFKISMLAPEGAEVQKGRPVMGFDTSELQRLLDQKSAEADEARKQIEKERNDLALKTKDERLRLAEAEARLRKAELKLDKPADITAISESKEAEIDFAVTKRETAAIRARIGALERAASARIALLESKRHEAESVVNDTQSAIRQMTVVAPRDGTVVYATSSRNGEKKKIGDNAWKTEKVIEIPDLTKMKADGEVDEVDVGRVSVGQRVTLRLDAHPDDEFHGTVTSAGRSVQQKRGTQDPLKILRVDIALDKTDPAKMRPGMRFAGTIELGRIRNAVMIPREAVFSGASGPFVWVRGTLSVDQVPVKLGKQNDKFVEVVNGLSAGDRVLVAKEQEEEKKG
jgi:multidrug efflux pump subunit AcrA (membrane-fusion protein)